MHEHPTALDVGEELVAEARLRQRRPRSDPEYRRDELAFAVVDRAEHRLERRERVVGDLRRRAGQPGEQRGLTGVWEPDQPGVGKQLQPQLDPARLALEAALGKPRRLARRGREALVAVTAGRPRR